MRLVENFIAGQYQASASGRRFEKRSPLDNRVIASVAEAGRPEVDFAVKAARDALRALILSIPVATDRCWRKLLGTRRYPAEARQHAAAVEKADEAVKAAEARAACARGEVLGRHRTRDQAVTS